MPAGTLIGYVTHSSCFTEDRCLLYSVSLHRYFSGHDHDLQHIRSEQPAMDMFVVGAGSYTVFSTAHEVGCTQ